eukprot:99807-Chlamydomonas_euryale.AAC.3
MACMGKWVSAAHDRIACMDTRVCAAHGHLYVSCMCESMQRIRQCIPWMRRPVQRMGHSRCGGAQMASAPFSCVTRTFGSPPLHLDISVEFQCVKAPSIQQCHTLTPLTAKNGLTGGCCT